MSTILLEVLLAEAVLRAVLLEALGGINHEDALAGGGVFLVEHDDAGGDARAEEEIGRQTDDAFDVTTLNEVAANRRPRRCRETGRHAEGCMRLCPSVSANEECAGGRRSRPACAAGRRKAGSALILVVLWIEAGAPTLVTEWRVGYDVVEGLDRIHHP